VLENDLREELSAVRCSTSAVARRALRRYGRPPSCDGFTQIGGEHGMRGKVLKAFGFFRSGR